MRFSCVLLIAIVACARQTSPTKLAEQVHPNSPRANAPPSLPPNTTTLRAEALERPIQNLRLDFVTPEFAEPITVPAPRLYEIELAIQETHLGATFEIALDAERPRLVSAQNPSITLGQLLPSESELSVGEHWLFAAPVGAAGVVPRAAPGAPPLAVARRFYVGKAEPARRDAAGVAWLRRPQGTYNGVESARNVLFDLFLFSSNGAPIERPSTVALRGPGESGELRLPVPFSLLDVPSGDFEVSVSADGVKPSVARFTVNREVGGVP